MITPLPKGHNLFEYQILGVLGQGGFGTTYLCLDANLQKRCVIKEFTPRGITTRKTNGDLKPSRWSLRSSFANSKASFLDEARKLATFNHINIVRVSRYFEVHNTAYFVMDYEAGRSLRSMLSGRPGIFSEPEIEAIILPVCKGLAELHRAGLLHRDIKPDNIIIRPDGSPALIDFGAAVRYVNQKAGALDIVVTPAYSPLEQFDPAAQQGPWTDLYALGAVMYEMVCGAPPLPSVDRAIGATMTSAAVIGRGRYGDRVLGLIDRCLLTDATRRPQSTDEFEALLGLDNDQLLLGIIRDTSIKMITHFINFARPNEGLYCDEIVAFTILFPVIDLSWRIGQGAPDKATFVRLFKLMSHRSLEVCWGVMAGAGFNSRKRHLTLDVVGSRLDEYAATVIAHPPFGRRATRLPAVAPLRASA